MRTKTWQIGLLAVSILILGGSLASAEVLETESKITEVVVFQDRALVTRQAEVELEPGVASIRLSGLPGTIEEQSITARGEGTAEVVLFGASLKTTQLTDSPSPRVKDLEDKIEALRDTRQEIEDRKKVFADKHEFLKSIRAASLDQLGKDLVTKQPSVSDVASLAAFLEDELAKMYQSLHQADLELRDIDEELNRLERELGELRVSFHERETETSIEVDLEAHTSGTFVLEVSYRLPGAKWAPTYEARAMSSGGDVQLTSYGQVRQRTGEDWNDVAIHLSTAKPAVGARMPEVEPWYLSIRPPVHLVAKLLDAAAPMRQEQYEREDKARAFESRYDVQAGRAAMAPAAVAQAAVSAQGPAVHFTLPKRETILSDWQPRKVAIQSYEFSAAFAYEISPKLSPRAYLRAKVTNEGDSILLQGPVQVFLDGAFVGTSSIDVIGPKEEFDLSLGIDERIRVERKQLSAKVDVSVLPGFHGRIKTIDYQYLTTVENYGQIDADIIVIDQLPVSQYDEIKIENVQLNPEPTEEVKDKPGVKRWAFKLPSAGKKEITLSYRVRHPVGMSVAGLDVEVVSTMDF